MVRNGTIGRVGTVRATLRPAESAAPRQAEPSRALILLDGGRAEAPRDAPAPEAATQKARGGTRPLAGFLTQMILEADPTLRPSRLERTGLAAARYAQAARLTA